MSDEEDSPPRLHRPPAARAARDPAAGVSSSNRDPYSYHTPVGSPVGCAYKAAAIGSPDRNDIPARRGFPVLPVASVMLVLGVLLGGALTFSRLEQPAERRAAQEYLELRAALVEQFEMMDVEHQVLLQQYFDFTQIYLTTRSTAPDDDRSSWNFMGSLYFCFTVITTIGYGTYTPSTEAGRLFCIFYALLGIPCFVIMTTIISEAILNTVRLVIKDSILEGVERGWLKTTPRFSISTLSLATLSVFVTIFVLSWAGAFSIYNGWSYLDSVYFGIVTVTTIGFGDMVPEGNALMAAEHVLYMCYFVFGLISMGTLITAVQKKVVEYQSRHNKKLRSKKSSVTDAQDTCDTPGTLRRMAYLAQMKTGQLYENSLRSPGVTKAREEARVGELPHQEPKFEIGDAFSDSDYAGSPPKSPLPDGQDIELMVADAPHS